MNAFLLLFEVRDEIDYEWVGTDLSLVQTNYYWQGAHDRKWQNEQKWDISGTLRD